MIQNGVVTTSRLRFIAQPNGYAASVILEAIPEQFQKVPSPIKENIRDTRFKQSKKEMVMHRPPLSGENKLKTSLKQSVSSCLLGNHSWLIYDSSITGGYVKQSVNVQNPKSEPIDLKIEITGGNTHFEVKLKSKSALGNVHSLLGGRELNIPVYFRPKVNGLHQGRNFF